MSKNKKPSGSQPGKRGPLPGRACNQPGALTIAASVMPEVLARIDAMAEQENISRSFAAGLCIERGLRRSK
jgi:hypothetical protein